MTTLLVYIFKITSPYSYFNTFSEHNSAAVRNILFILGRITEQVSAKCRIKNDNFA